MTLMNPFSSMIRHPLVLRLRPSATRALPVFFLLLAASLPTALSAQGSEGDPGLERLERELVHLSATAQGVVGVGVIHLETGRELFLNRNVAFPMASTYKVPIAVELLHRVDRNELRLDSLFALTPADISPGSGTLSRLFQHPGVSLSLRNLTELMMLISDNSATDVVLRTAGGGDAVTARMRALGHDGMRVDRSTTALIADFIGVRELPPEAEVTPERFGELTGVLSREERDAAGLLFESDPRDTSTPEAMARLLAQLWHAEAISRESSDLLLDIMSRSTTGQARIPGMLPRGTRVSHKTGTIGRVTNHVGIIHLPRDAGNVVTVVFVKESEAGTAASERTIADISRSVYDYFLFNPGGTWP